MSEVNDAMIKAVLQIMRAAKMPDAAQPTVTQPQPPTLFDKLESGQLYQVTVLNPNLDGKALLRILGEKVLVDTTLPLQQGQRLTVEVVSKNNDVIELQLKPAPTHEEIKAQYLKLTLPKQQPIADLVKTLNDYLAGQPANRIVSAPQAALQTLIRELISSLPTAGELRNPASFQRVLAESGIFLESQLARGQPVQNDLKAIFFKIAEQLRPQITASLQNSPAMTAYNAASSTAISPKTAAPIAQTQVPAVVGTPGSRPAAEAAPAAAEKTVQANAPIAGKTVQQTATPSATGSTAHEISPLKGAAEKTGLTATQAAQKAMMLGKSNPMRLIQSITANLMNNTAIQAALSLLPKTELQLLLKQIMLKNTAGSEQVQSAVANQRLGQLEVLLRSVESGLARIQTQQLASVPQDDATRQVWQLEIPMRDQKELHTLLMRIEQDDSEADKDANGSTWTVSLNFNIGKLGLIHSKIRLTAEVVSTHFWAEEPKTLQKISSGLPRLSTALEKLGLSVNHMTAALGKPPDPVEIAATEARLLDENA